jgi:hypothetical protein
MIVDWTCDTVKNTYINTEDRVVKSIIFSCSEHLSLGTLFFVAKISTLAPVWATSKNMFFLKLSSDKLN